MGLFRKKSARVVRRGSATEERTVRTVGGEAVTVRRFSTADAPARTDATKQKQKRKPKPQGQQKSKPADLRRRRRPAHIEVAPPPDTARKQMLVRTMPHQTQIVVLEGPVLVEHYVAPVSYTHLTLPTIYPL